MKFLLINHINYYRFCIIVVTACMYSIKLLCTKIIASQVNVLLKSCRLLGCRGNIFTDPVNSLLQVSAKITMTIIILSKRKLTSIPSLSRAEQGWTRHGRSLMLVSWSASINCIAKQLLNTKTINYTYFASRQSKVEIFLIGKNKHRNVL